MKNKIIDYIIVDDLDEDSFAKPLEEKVRNLMENGWQPFGGVNLSYGEYADRQGFRRAQAMVKYEDSV